MCCAEWMHSKRLKTYMPLRISGAVFIWSSQFNGMRFLQVVLAHFQCLRICFDCGKLSSFNAICKNDLKMLT